MGHQFSDEGGASIQTIPGGGDLLLIKKDKFFKEIKIWQSRGFYISKNPLLDLQKVGGGFVAKDPNIAPKLRIPTIYCYAGIS